MKLNWQFSNFARKYHNNSGILQLMNDLGKLNPNQYIMLGGGTPSYIKKVNQFFNQELKELTQNQNYFNRFPFKYSSPQGEKKFLKILAKYFQDFFQTKKISEKNITLTLGSQNSFYALFNIFSGTFPQKKKKKILFPLVPEYIGYEDVFLEPNSIISFKPIISFRDNCFFKYQVDLEKINSIKNFSDQVGAIAFSRPCNPSGNLLTDKEIKELYCLSKKKQVPLIIDNAYGLPFPKIVYKKTKPFWDGNIIYTFSFSKIGLPGIRTGGIIANPTITKIFSAYNAITALSPPTMGIGLLEKSIYSKKINQITEQTIKPFYTEKRKKAIAIFQQLKGDLPIYLHQVEGSFFLWIWFKGLTISTLKFYEILKKKKVIVIPGEYFFYQFKHTWKHAQECIRLHYGVDKKTLTQGLEIIFKTAKKYLKKKKPILK